MKAAPGRRWPTSPSSGTFDISSFLSLLLPEAVLADAALSENVAGLKEAVGALEKRGLDKYYGPCRRFVAAPVAGDLAAPDSDQAQDSPPDYFFGGDLWKTTDGLRWEPVTLNGFGNPRNHGLRNMLRPTHNSLLIGTSNPFDGLEVLRAVKRH